MGKLILVLVSMVMFMTTSFADSHLVLITDPRVIAIPILENNEAMVDVREHPEISIGPSPEIPNNPDYTKVRKTVYDKIVQAQQLLPPGLHFYLMEGYRSLHTQKMIFEKRYAIVKNLHPKWTDSQVFHETTRLVSPVILPDGSKNIPPHSTGGAIDIVLLDAKGHMIDMGFDPYDWVNDNEGLSLTATTKISAQAKSNRQILIDALSAVGFANYTSEFWHWSYGDRYWAYSEGKTAAIYNSY